MQIYLRAVPAWQRRRSPRLSALRAFLKASRLTNRERSLMEVPMIYARAAAAPALLIALVGCQGPLNSPTASGFSAAHNLVMKTAPDGDNCQGTGRVKVQPCPVTLIKKHSTIVVTVSGPGVTSSAQKTNSKNHSFCGSVCSVGQFSSSPLKYDVSAGTKCGSAKAFFYGYNASGNSVGIGRLTVINKDC